MSRNFSDGSNFSGVKIDLKHKKLKKTVCIQDEINYFNMETSKQIILKTHCGLTYAVSVLKYFITINEFSIFFHKSPQRWLMA